jgi:hypothetical protein
MFRAIKGNRVARWAAFALALNAWALVIVVFDHLRSDRTLDLFVPASDVQQYINPNTRELAYRVSNVSVEKIVERARWPNYGSLYGVFGVNLAFAVWLLRLGVVESRRQAPEPSPATKYSSLQE